MAEPARRGASGHFLSPIRVSRIRRRNYVVYSLVSAAGQPYVADQVATQLGIPENAGSVAGPQQKYDGELYYERLKAQGFADVANNGLFVQPDSSASESEKADYTDGHGTP